jgi:hypothetical protein
MTRTAKVIAVALVAVIGLAASADAIVRVKPRWTFSEFYAGFGTAYGSYSGLPIDAIGDFDPYRDAFDRLRVPEFDADVLWGTPFQIGLNIGQVRNGHIAYSFGFRYTRHDLKAGPYENEEVITTLSFVPELHQFDLAFNIGYFLTDISTSAVSPYIGVGFLGGLTHANYELVEDEQDANLALAVNFGADLRLTEPNRQGAFWAISSVNSFEFVGTSNRPKYVNFGAALKYYFKGF